MYNEDYSDIINLPHHQSKTRPHMTNYNRAAQFAPFAALTGHSEAIDETARLTDSKIELDEYEKEIIDRKLRIITENISTMPEITVCYFVPDEKKAGGAYVMLLSKKTKRALRFAIQNRLNRLLKELLRTRRLTEKQRSIVILLSYAAGILI